MKARRLLANSGDNDPVLDCGETGDDHDKATTDLKNPPSGIDPTIGCEDSQEAGPAQANFGGPEPVPFLEDDELVIGGADGVGPRPVAFYRLDEDAPYVDGMDAEDWTGTENGEYVSGSSTDGPVLGAEGIPGDSLAEAVAVQKDGRALVGGWTGDPRYSVGFVVRYLEDGRIDESFAGGRLRIPLPEGRFALPVAAVRDIALDGKGRLLLAISAGGRVDRNNFGAVMRVLPNGRIDRSFAHNGRLIVRTETDRAEVSSVRAEADRAEVSSIRPAAGGRILFSGFAARRHFVARLKPNGSYDRAFGDRGTVTRRLMRGGPCLCGDDVTQLLPLPDGDVQLLAYWNTGGAVMRLHADGSPDLSFGNQGVVRFDGFAPRRAAVLADRSTVLFGHQDPLHRTMPPPSSAITRLTPEGAVDPTFFDAGWLRPDAGATSALRTVAADAAGNLTAAGFVRDPAVSEGATRFLLVSLTN